MGTLCCLKLNMAFFSHSSHQGPKTRDEARLFAPFIVKESWCREGEREGTQGYQLRLETAPVLLRRFLITGIEP